MAKFNYISRNSQGQKIEGMLEASNATAAASMLQAKQLIPVRIEPEVESVSKDIDLKQFLPKAKVTLNDLSMFCRQMHALTRAGMPIVRAISGLAETSSNETLAELLQDISSNLVTGMAQRVGADFAEAAATDPESEAVRYRSAVLGCSTCRSQGECQQLQDDCTHLDAAPEYCVNKDMLEAMVRN